MKKKHLILGKEAQFFDSRAADIDIQKINLQNAFNKNSREGQFILKTALKNLKNKRILDIGCGWGASSVFLAKKGANVIGIDISDKAISVAKKLAKLHEVDKFSSFKSGDIENLIYKNNSFDIVIGKAVLHHVDLPKALREVHRVLKPKGIAIFSDPLDYNPVIKLYDKILSEDLCSPNERRLNLTDLNTVKSIFKKVDWIGTDITSLILFFCYFLYLKLTKQMIFGWFESIQDGYKLVKLYAFFNKIDSLLPKIIQLLGWRIVIICQK